MGVTHGPIFYNNYSMEFDGTTGYVDIGDLGDIFNYSAGDSYTVSLWYNSTSMGNFDTIINLSLRPYGFTLLNGLGGTISFGYGNISASKGLVYSWLPTAGRIDDGLWHHICITVEPGPTMIAYVDGSSSGSGGGTSAVTEANNRIGNGNYGGVVGNIDEVAIFTTALSSSEVLRIYSNGIPSGIATFNPVVWYRMGDNAIYRDPQWLIPNNENKDKFSNYSLEFNGTGNSVQCGAASLGITSTISVSAWVKIPTTNTGGPAPYVQVIVCEDTTSTTIPSQRNWILAWRGTGYNRFSFTVFHTNDGTSSSNAVSTGITPNDGEWHHVMGTFDGTTGSEAVKLYVDETEFTGAAVSPILYSNPDIEPTIGALTNSVNWHLEGQIDDVSIFDTALSVGEVTAIYNNGKPSDLSLLNPLAWYRMAESANWEVDSSGNWQIPNDVSEYPQCFNYGNRSEKKIIELPLQGVNVENAITISAWIKTQITGSGGVQQTIISNDNSTYTYNRSWNLNIGADWASGYRKATFYFFNSDGSLNFSLDQTSSQILPDNKWHHILALWDGTTNTNGVKIFVDGLLAGQGTSTFAGPIQQSVNSRPYIGATASDTTGVYGVGKYFGGFTSGTIGDDGKLSNISVWDIDLTYGMVSSIGDTAGGQVAELYNNGVPITTIIQSANLKGWWKLDSTATFSTDWTVPDASGNGNDGTSIGMTEQNLVYNNVSTLNGDSSGMDIYNRVGSAPNSENNALSYNVALSGRTTDVPT